MFRLTEVVKNLLIINVLFYIGSFLVLGDIVYSQGHIVAEKGDLNRMILALWYPAHNFFEPWQLVTHMFMHADLIHLGLNMFVLAMFGPILESLFGHKRFLFLYLAAGFGALILDLLIKFIRINYFGDHAAMGHFSLGASGAIYGLVVAFAMKFPNQRISLIFPPISGKAKYFVAGFLAIDLIFGVTSINTGIAHFAHLGGALFGALSVIYFNKFNTRWLN